MSYINKNLQTNETIEYKANIHWFIFVMPIIGLAFGYIFYSTKTSLTHYTGLIILILSSFQLLKRLLFKISTEYVITNKRVILKIWAILSRDALGTPGEQNAEGLRINQSFIDVSLDLGQFSLLPGGVTNTFRFVANPIKFRNEINRQI